MDYKPHIFSGNSPWYLINSNWLEGHVVLPMSLQGLQDHRNWFINCVGYSNYFWYIFHIFSLYFYTAQSCKAHALPD